MALVDDHEGVGRQVLHEGRRRLSGLAPREVPGVVLDPLAVAHLLEHLHVEAGALLEPLGLQELPLRLQKPEPLAQLLPDGDEGRLQRVPRRDVMAPGVDVRFPEPPQFLPPEGVHDGDRLDHIAEELDADGLLLLVGREDLHHVPPDPEGAAVEIDIISLVVDIHEAPKQRVAGDLHPLFEGERHAEVGLGGADAVDAGDARHDDHVAAREDRARGRVAHLVDLLVDRGVLLDVGVRRRDVGLGLVVVVIAHEVLDGVLREQRFELLVELRRQGLVGGDDQGGTLDGLDDVGHREGLARTGDPEEDLVRVPLFDPPGQLFDGLGLVPPGLEVGDEPEGPPVDVIACGVF